MESRRLREALGHRRFGGGPPGVLVFDTGYFVVGDVVDAAQELGWRVRTLKTPMKGRAQDGFIADLLTALVIHQPDFVLTINHFGFDERGALATLLDDYQIPVASWFVDHPAPIIGGAVGAATASCQLFCFERTALPWLREQGFCAPYYLPTASNRRRFHPSAVDRRRGVEQAWPLTFVGNSWWRKAREEPTPWVRREARSFSRRHRVTRGALANGMLRKLEQIRPPAGGSGSARFDVARAVLAEASLQTRGRFARALMPQGLRVHGDPGWRELVPGIEQRPYVDYETELASLFAASAVNANVTAEQMPTAVNQRVWDVPGTGAFLLTDAQEDALEFFKEDEEVVVYRDFSEAADKASYYREHDSARRAIAARAFEVVERSHRYVHRLAELERVMQRRFG